MSDIAAPLSLGREIMGWADALAAVTETPGSLTRTFLTPQHRQAADLAIGWMEAAGMSARLDSIGNVVGRYEGDALGRPALLLGSHLDTVRDAGRYDGMLGVLTAIACVGALHREGTRLPFAIEIFGFGDEEGVRFQSTLIGSRAVAGTFDPALLAKKDAQGTTLADALRTFGLDPARIPEAARRRDDALAYVELHIEQGPVLESKDLALGVVTSIAGVGRFTMDITGQAGHAGTVPMGLRRDALTAAAEAVVAIERCCAEHGGGVVGTVGQLTVSPGATNVIPGHVRFSLDIRAARDEDRRSATELVLERLHGICDRRGLRLDVTQTHENGATACAPWLMDQIGAAIAGEGIAPFRLLSGAGHDAMALADLVDVGMLFVRCARGISHNPAESITTADADIGARAFLRFIRHFTPKPGQA